MDTPLSAYKKLASGKLLLPILNQLRVEINRGRYFIIGFCRTLVDDFGSAISVEQDGLIVEQAEMDDPLIFHEQFQQRYKAPDMNDLPVFTGGLVGYFGYDTVRYVEPSLKKSTPRDELGTPDILLMVSDEVVVFDNLAGKIHIVCYASLHNENDDDFSSQIKHVVDETNARIDILQAQLLNSTSLEDKFVLEQMLPLTQMKKIFYLKRILNLDFQKMNIIKLLRR